MGVRSLDRSFAGGEITPELYGRADLTTFQTGLALCKNFITLPHGPAENRPGFEFVRETKDSTKRSRLIPFVYSSTQTMMLEFGDRYIRFHTNGGTLLSGSVPYEVVTPYLPGDVANLHYVQSADVMTLASPDFPTKELRRLGPTNWQLIDVSFSITQPGLGSLFTVTKFSQNAPIPLGAPAFVDASGFAPGPTDVEYAVEGIQDYVVSNGLKVSGVYLIDTASSVTVKWGRVGGAVGYRLYRRYNGSGLFFLIAEIVENEFIDDRTAANSDFPGFIKPINEKLYNYVITTVGASGEESLPTVVKSENHDLTYPGNAINIEPQASGISYVTYNVYKNEDGSAIFGYIGNAKNGTKFSDNNIEPDFTRQPPVNSNPFSGAGNYPQAVSYYQQRRLFAGTLNLPQNLWGTKTGTESNLSTNVVVRDDDAISFRISALKVTAIRHIVPLGDVILLSNSGEWRLNSTDGGGITPATISVKPQSYVGASNVQPCVTESSVLYGAARGGHIREIIYRLADNGAVGYNNADLSLLAPHLFNFKNVTDLAFSAAPYPILWAVSSDGKLLGLTYVPEQKVAGWHRHETDGLFESCAVVAEGDEDVLYVIVSRNINGVQRRYVERMHSRQFQSIEDAFFVDCGDTYSGAPTSTITGLGHLEGKQVAVLGDGAVFPLKTVTGGAITLERPVELAHIGLPIVAEIQTLPMTIEQLADFGQGRAKNVNKVFMRVYKSSIVKAGATRSTMQEFKQRTTEPYGSAPDIIDQEEIEIPLVGTWMQNGQVIVQQTEPLPLTVLSMALDVAVGG